MDPGEYTASKDAAEGADKLRHQAFITEGYWVVSDEQPVHTRNAVVWV